MGWKVCVNGVQITYNLCSTIKLYRAFVGHCQNIPNQGRFNVDLTSVNIINTEFKKYILKLHAQQNLI